MWMLPKTKLPSEIRDMVVAELLKSRFRAVCAVESFRGGRRLGVKLETIRLLHKKAYCGAHPGPCIALFPRRRRTGFWLEGLDWVGFNAMLNDLLDRHSIDCDVFSYNRETIRVGRYYIRRGRSRRIGYPYDYLNNFAHWLAGDPDRDFKDYCGKPPPEILSDDLGDTPGIPCYTLREEKRLKALPEYAEDHH